MAFEELLLPLLKIHLPIVIHHLREVGHRTHDYVKLHGQMNPVLMM